MGQQIWPEPHRLKLEPPQLLLPAPTQFVLEQTPVLEQLQQLVQSLEAVHNSPSGAQEVGLFVGERDGGEVGAFVGPAVNGGEVGLFVGERDGAVDGGKVGEFVGVRDGGADGGEVGAFVGGRDGDADGGEVGAFVGD